MPRKDKFLKLSSIIALLETVPPLISLAVDKDDESAFKKV